MNKILDVYYRIPIFIDLLVVILVLLINSFWPILEINVTDSTLENILSSIIDTSVALAGFILAALTIIVTFKSNLKAKGIEEAKNAFEMILSSKHYLDIVKTFKSSIFELTCLFTISYIIWLIKGSFGINIKFNLAVSTIIILSLSIGRSLLLLFRILKLESN